VNSRPSDRILDLAYRSEASAGAPDLLVGVRERQRDEVIGEGYIVG
jgi:hypothetical protein